MCPYQQVDHWYIQQVTLMVTELEIALLFSPNRPSATFGFTRRSEKRSRIVAFTLRDVATGTNVHELVRRGRRPFGASCRVCLHISTSNASIRFAIIYLIHPPPFSIRPSPFCNLAGL